MAENRAKSIERADRKRENGRENKKPSFAVLLVKRRLFMRRSEEIRCGNSSAENKNRQNKFLKIAVTGGIGSGKSTVCGMLRAAGYSVFSCDEIYAGLLKKRDFCMALEILFPGATSGGAIDRAALRNIVFSDRRALERLNAFTHPAIMQALNARIENVRKEGKEIVFAEVPLLFEERYDALFDKIIVVERNEADKIKSVILRDSCTQDVVRQKMAAQFDYYLLHTRNDYPSLEKIVFLQNDGDKNDLKKSLNRLLKEIV